MMNCSRCGVWWEGVGGHSPMYGYDSYLAPESLPPQLAKISAEYPRPRIEIHDRAICHVNMTRERRQWTVDDFCVRILTTPELILAVPESGVRSG